MHQCAHPRTGVQSRSVAHACQGDAPAAGAATAGGLMQQRVHGLFVRGGAGTCSEGCVGSGDLQLTWLLWCRGWYRFPSFLASAGGI